MILVQDLAPLEVMIIIMYHYNVYLCKCGVEITSKH